MSAYGEAPSYLAEMLEHRSDNPALHRQRNTANRRTGQTRRSSFEAEDVWITKLRQDWAISLEQFANWSHQRDTEYFNLQNQAQNISIQTAFPGQIETLHQLHERLWDGLAIKKRYSIQMSYTLH